MAVTCTEQGSTLTATLTGEVDHHAARALMTTLSTQVEAALPMKLVLDLGGVTFMDSSGIALVLRLYKRMGELGGTLTLRAVPTQSAKVLKAAGIDRLVPWEGA